MTSKQEGMAMLVGGRLDRRVGLLLVALALFAAGCGGGGETETETAGAESNGDEVSQEAGDGFGIDTLRVGFASDPDFTQIANYKWLQDLEEMDGIEVEESYFRSSQDSFRALVSGEVDLAFGTLSSGIALVSEGGDPIKAIVSDMKAPDYILVADDELDSLQALEGQRVGISTPGDISDSLTRALLTREGVDVSKVEFLQIGGTSARMSALLADQIDAGPAHAADGLSAIEEGDLKNLYSYGNSIGDYLQQVVFVNDEWAAENAEFVQHAVNRFIDSVRWAASEKDEYLELAGEFVEGLDPAIANQAYDIFADIEMFAVNGGMSEELLDNTVDIEQEVGALGADVPPKEQWADASFVERYLEENGEV
jgi:ABC-type nitrate/sulfonate/bicarbonate transport system substrate-binding protein